MNKKHSKYLWLLIFIPIVAASILFWSFYNSTPIKSAKLSSEKLGTLNFTDSEQCNIIDTMLNEASIIEAPIKPLEEYHRFKLTVSNLTGDTDYTLYLSGIATDTLFTDTNGTLYRISTENALWLLTLEGMEFIDPNYNIPMLSFKTEGKITDLSSCQSSQWTYIGADEIEHQRSENSTASLSVSLSNAQQWALEFSVEPDWSLVTIKDNDNTIFSDSISELSSFAYSKDAELSVTVEAQWNKNSSLKKYYGSCNAQFTLSNDAPASFLLSSESCYPGELIALLCKNCHNGEISLTGAQNITENAKIIEYCGEKIVLLPIDMTTAHGDYSFKVSGEGSEFDFTLKVNEKSFATEILSNLSYNDLKTAIEEEAEILNDVFKNSSATALWSGSFSVPVSGEDSWISTRFGSHLKAEGYNGSIRHHGVDYVQLPSTFIAASNDGEVIFAGKLPYSGNTVIVDHGLGYCTVYSCLDTVSVTKGMKVFRSQTLGTLGNSGITGGSYLHFDVRIWGISINPHTVLGTEPDFFDLKLSGN